MSEVKDLILNVEYPMIYIPPGSFMMGNEKDEWLKLVHEVIIVRGFYLGKYPVTQKLWKVVMGDFNNPSEFKGDSRPVETVSWDQVKIFIQKLNKQLNNKFDFRLPSESEWEYAARGGELGAKENLKFSGSNRLEEAGWYYENSGNQTKPVGLKMGNQLGIHDMSGNVWEWCQDNYEDNYNNHPLNGDALLLKNLNNRVVRGGSWASDDINCSVFYRERAIQVDGFNDIGFRLIKH